jgi:hypothetical protein
MNDMMMKKKRPRGLEDGVYTEDSGLPPPQDIDGGSAPKPRKPKKFADGGAIPGLEVPGLGQPIGGMPTPGDGGGGGDGGSAFGGLGMVNSGAQTIGSALSAAQNNIGGGGGGTGGMKRGGKVKSKGYASGGSVGSASKRGDGIAQRGKTRGKYL